jgi:predicted phosphoadenosine phosphosulfate sulfurtransferase
MSRKLSLGVDVLSAARERIAFVFDSFPRVYVSFSGGKDSTVMLHMVMDEAIKRRRVVGVLFVDLEAQYRLTIEHIEECFHLYADHIDPHWIALPIALRNAVSQFEPKWMCWDRSRRDDWVRQPSELSITDPSRYLWFREGMEFEELVPAFGHWYSQGELTACLVGIRADESLNRFRTLIIDKTRFQNLSWTTWLGGSLYNAYPIYDWKTEDIWTFHARTGRAYNRIYDRMHKAGLTVDQMRICQPYGDDQRKGLWLYSVMEPETWGRVVARVNGANSGALYAHETGVMAGRIKIIKPPGHSWQSYTMFLLESMPPKSKLHFENKIAVFLKWYQTRGYPNGIPDEADPKAEAKKEIPTWRRVCRVILKNDYWCKGLSFGQHKSTSYERYLKVMKERRKKWGI